MAMRWKLSECRADRNAGIGVMWDATPGDQPSHTHEFAELVVVAAGECLHCHDGGEHPIRRGDVFLADMDTVHGYRDRTDGFELVNVVFEPGRMLLSPEYLSLIPGYHALFQLGSRNRLAVGTSPVLHLNGDDLRYTLSLVSGIEGELAERATGYEAAIQAIFLQLAVFLSRRFTASAGDSSAALVRMGGVLGYIGEHYQEALSVPALAAVANMSVNHFMRTFAKATGLTPVGYVTRFRVRMAAQLMADRGRTITEIAYAVGFGNGCHFSRQFKRLMGLSPTEYRVRMASRGSVTG